MFGHSLMVTKFKITIGNSMFFCSVNQKCILGYAHLSNKILDKSSDFGI